MSSNQNFDLDSIIQKFKDNHPDYERERQIYDSAREKFVATFTRERLSNLTIDEYVVGKRTKNDETNKETFCYLLESSNLKAFGPINVGRTPAKDKFGIAYRKSKSNYEFPKKLGNSSDEVFSRLRAAIVELIDAGERGDLKAIGDSILTPTFRGKILATYYPDSYLGIFTKGKLEEILNSIGIPYSNQDSEMDLQRKLISWKKDHDSYFSQFDLQDFSKLLYESSNILKSMKDSGDSQIDLNVDQVNNREFKNTILYGPPGTGKTYHSIIYAVAICENLPVSVLLENIEQGKRTYEDILDTFADMKSDGRIEFVTFHQSYSYEDFVEGIRPTLLNEKTDIEIAGSTSESNNTNMRYELVPGIFKRMCTKAGEYNAESLFENSWNQLVDAVHKSGDDSWTFTRPTTGSRFEAKLNGADSFRIERPNSYNPLGKQSVKKQWIKQEIRPAISNGTQFLFDARSAIINELTRFNLPPAPPTESAPENHVLIIDEINRGNISKIFGELITLIEEDKRIGSTHELTATLPYSKDTFGVPSNLYIIGTMNTADRSISLMDSALRRRFNFIEMKPDSDVLANESIERDSNISSVALDQLLNTLNDRIEALYNREHCIGHSYLMNIKTIEDLRAAFSNRIIPLLQEYFYDDYGKISAILGDDAVGKAGDKRFILKTTRRDSLFFSDEYESYETRETYSINSLAAFEATDFQAVYSLEANEISADIESNQ